MKNILFSLLIALNLVSCSNNDDNNQNQTPYLAILPVNINLNLNLPEYSALKFPGNSIIYLYMAIPIKTKYFVAGIGCLALFNGIGNNPGDNVAHFAHLGGMIFGIILLKYWKKKGDIYFAVSDVIDYLN